MSRKKEEDDLYTDRKYPKSTWNTFVCLVITQSQLESDVSKYYEIL